MSDKFDCPYCNKTIIEKNQNNILSKDIIIKSKLIFLNEDGNILGKCSSCKKLISLPLMFNEKDKFINSNIIDL